MTVDATFDQLLSEAYASSSAGAYAKSLDAAQRALGLARQESSIGRELRATRIEASTLSLMGRQKEALARLDWALETAAGHRASPVMKEPRVAQAVVATYLDWAEITGLVGAASMVERLDVLDRADDLLAAIDKPQWRSGVLSMRATIMQSLGRMEEAVALGAEAIRCFDTNDPGPGSTLASYRQQHADLLAALPGDDQLESAEVQYMQILVEPRRSVRNEKSAYVGLARCALRRGDGEEARHRAQKALELAAPMGDAAMCGPLEILAKALRAIGELDHAAAVADQLIERSRKSGSPTRLFYALRAQIDLSFEREDHASARAWLEEASELASSLDQAAGGDQFARQLHARKARLDEGSSS